MTTATLLTALSLLATFSTGDSFSFPGFSRSISLSSESLAARPDILADSISRAFPENTHQNPAYASVLAYLHSLETKPSCHRSATASLITDCNVLSSSADTYSGDLRYQYAAQLAVCEFEATGVWYPGECKGLKSGRHARCIQRLEERPQWWTTLSNNIQNAMVICAAVRHEVEQGKLLDLHRNVTKAQEQLFRAMDTSLDQVSTAQAEQKVFSERWEGFWRRVTDDVEELRVGVGKKVRLGGINLEIMLDRLMDKISDAQMQSEAGVESMNAVVKKTNEDSMIWSSRVQQAWEEIDTMISKASKSHDLELSRAAKSLEELNELLITTTASSFQALHNSAFALSTELSHAAESIPDLSTLPELYTSLITTQVSLARSQSAAEARQRDILATLDTLEPRINAMASTLLLSAERVGKSLEDADTRIQTLGGVWNRKSVALWAMAFGLSLWFGKENWRSFAGAMGVIFGASMWWSAHPQLQRFPAVGQEVAVVVFSAEIPKYVGAWWGGVSAIAGVLILLVVAGRKCWGRQGEEKEKLPA